MGKNTKKSQKVNDGSMRSTTGQPRFNASRMAGKRAGQCRAKRIQTEHVLGSGREYESAAEWVGRPVPKHADLWTFKTH